MTQRTGNDNKGTVNAGPAPKQRDPGEYDIAGNSEEHGEKASPSARDRGETSRADQE